MEKIADSTEVKNYSQAVQLFSSCATVGMSTIGGAIIGGIPGALIGLTTSVFDFGDTLLQLSPIQMKDLFGHSNVQIAHHTLLA